MVRRTFHCFSLLITCFSLSSRGTLSGGMWPKKCSLRCGICNLSLLPVDFSMEPQNRRWSLYSNGVYTPKTRIGSWIAWPGRKYTLESPELWNICATTWKPDKDFRADLWQYLSITAMLFFFPFQGMIDFSDHYFLTIYFKGNKKC